MVNLDLNVLEVVQLLEDARILHVAVQRVTVGPIVRINTVSTAIVVVGSSFMQSFDGGIFLSIGDGNNYVHLQATLMALWNKEPVWQPKAALKFLNVEFLALMNRFLGPVLNKLEAGYIRDSHRGVIGIALKVIVARVHWKDKM